VLPPIGNDFNKDEAAVPTKSYVPPSVTATTPVILVYLQLVKSVPIRQHSNKIYLNIFVVIDQTPGIKVASYKGVLISP